ncbi:hypothetical protein PUNSTDRAFT_125170 [Punctularia strigosozonata HHB-11173 SS5]|uniref:uncharacterized protein n=1 Tax=Punctularia strigosozonata (strain HHB-11173) TaxID=741275 RepID=UPI000441696D|nr:uncharacterized protein PUNSTDRAFT_125170 [Punctularia strigosozonata HHB-11173 SS5]EIN10205.1 hypothetical protein PUNSTDRAFT_125170 [Punctularia strigosozonata HHB-11173 SS5]
MAEERALVRAGHSGPQTTEPQRPTKRIDRVETAFVQSLEDPSHPRHCASFYETCLLDMLDEVHTGKLEISRSKFPGRFPDAFDTMMRFLSYPRSSAELHAVAESLKTCHCDLSQPFVKTLHKSSSQTASRPGVKDCWHLMCDFIGSAVEHFIGTDHSVRSKLKKSQRRLTWPASTDDVAPYGLEATINALANLVELRISSVLTILRSIVAVFGRTAALQILLKHETLPSSLYALLVYYADAAWQHDPRKLRNLDKPYSTIFALDLTSQYFMDLISSPPLDLITFLLRADQPSDAFVTQWSRILDWATATRDSLPPGFVRRFNTPHKPNSYTYLLDILDRAPVIGGVLHLRQSTSAMPGPTISPAIARVAENSYMPIVASLDGATRQYGQNARCFARGCPWTEAVAMRRFSVCGGCEHMKYCSPECQRAAWADAVAPHKPICRLLALLRERGLECLVWAHGAGRSPALQGVNMPAVMETLVNHLAILESPEEARMPARPTRLGFHAIPPEPEEFLRLV